MGVWQVTEESQPFVGQWDATTDTFWNGVTWVSPMEWPPAQISTTGNFGIGAAGGFGTPGNGYYGHGSSNQVTSNLSGKAVNWLTQKLADDLLKANTAATKQTQEPPKPDVWSALQSMF